METARQYLSPSILRIVDSYNSGVSYKDMQPGQSLTIHAEDAASKQPSFFTLEVLSVRKLDERRDTMTATLRYKEGDFSFYNGENPAGKPGRLTAEFLMENGISGTLIPQTDIRMSYFGGIGLGRDHSFEYVDGEDRSVLVHNLTAIDIENPPADWQQPDLTEHFRKLEATKVRQEQERREARENNDRNIEAFVEEKFKNHLLLGQIQEKLQEFSPNGKIVIASYLGYALEDDVFDRAWEILKKACDDHYSYQHPMVRGDIEVLGQNRTKLMEMTREAGITWPRPNRAEEVDQEGPEVGEITNIKIPEDQELQAKLQRKLVEYQGRLKEPRSLASITDTNLKTAVLAELLEKEEVSAETLRARLSKESWFDEDRFEVAFWIINEYCRTGGQGRVVGAVQDLNKFRT